MCGPGASTDKTTRVVTGTIPLFLAAAVVYSAYVVISRVCYGYFIEQGWAATAHAVVALLSVSLLLMAASYMRLIFVIQRNPGLVPLPPRPRDVNDDGPFDITAPAESRPGGSVVNAPGDPEVQLNEVRDLRHDRPDLEAFYSLDAFVCDAFGHPRYCSNCANWKPDRAHHSGEIGRCVRKMDHYCPWVGGMVAETSFKFFIQFVCYAALYCLLALVTSALALSAELRAGEPAEAQLCVVIGLAAFFGLFTGALAIGCLHYLIRNTTNVDAINFRSKRYRLALRIPDEDATYRGAIFVPIVSFPLGPAAFRPRWAPPRDVGPDDETDDERDARHAREDAATGRRPSDPPAPPRPRRRHFAIVTTQPGENPWDCGWHANVCSVMGKSPLDWLLPIRESPCAYEMSDRGFYRFGPLIETLRARHGIRRPEDVDDGEKSSLL